jgi:hypothetical protein
MPVFEKKAVNERYLILGEYLPNLKTLKELRENKVDAETLKNVIEAEFHHFCRVQITYNTIVSFLLSLFGLGICLICIYTMDYHWINKWFGTDL